MYWLNLSSPIRTISSRGRSRCIICRSSRTTKSIRSKSLTLSIEPPVTDEIVLVEQCTTWSEEAVLGHTYSSISCANMKCFAFSRFSCVKTIESVHTRWGWWGCGGQVERFNDLVFTVVRGAVSVVRSGEVISVLREEEYQVISFQMRNTWLEFLQVEHGEG